MQVKTCPKCGFENKPTNASCSKCYAELEGVPRTKSTRPEEPVAPAGAATGPVVRPARPSPPPSSSPPAGPSQAFTPPTNVTTAGAAPPAYTHPGTSGGAEQIKITIGPPHRKPHALVIIPAVIVVCILAAFALGRGPTKPPKPKVPPDKVVLSFLAAKKSGETIRVRPYLSADSIYRLEHTFDSKQARSAGIDKKEVASMLLFDQAPTPRDIAACNMTATVVEDKDVDENMAIVHVSLEPIGKSEGEFSVVLATESEYVLVQEGSEWKVDLHLSNKRQSKQGFEKLLGGQLPGTK